MSTRQLIFSVIAAVMSIGIALLSLFVWHVSIDTAGWLIILIDIPVLAFGWFKKNGFYFERYAKMMLKYYFQQGIRPYKTELNDKGGQGNARTKKERRKDNEKEYEIR